MKYLFKFCIVQYRLENLIHPVTFIANSAIRNVLIPIFLFLNNMHTLKTINGKELDFNLVQFISYAVTIIIKTDLKVTM